MGGRTALALHPRAVPDFPDALVALHLLAREGNGPGARYSNTPEGALFLDKNSPAYLGGMLAMANQHMQCTSFDLPKVEPIAMRRIAAAGVSGRVKAVAGDFFTDALPKADVITMGMILHDWNLEKKKILIRKACQALPPGGAFVVIEALIDDARRENALGLLMSLNMLIEFGDAFDYSGADFVGLVQGGRVPRVQSHPARRPFERRGRLQVTGSLPAHALRFSGANRDRTGDLLNAI